MEISWIIRFCPDCHLLDFGPRSCVATLSGFVREESDVSEKLLTPNFPVDNNKKKAKTILKDFLNILNSGGPVLTGRGEEQT